MNRKQQIVEFSADLLRTKGFEGFSYQDISKELGITKASVHHHFPKKMDLGLALCDWSKEWLLDGLQHFDRHGTSQWNRLERYLKAAVKHTLRDHKMCPVSAFYNDLNRLPESLAKAVKAIDVLELEWVERVIRDGIDEGEFSSVDSPKAMAAMFVFTCKGAIYYARLHGEDMFQQSMAQFKHWLLQP